MSPRNKSEPTVEGWPAALPIEFDGYSVVRFVGEDAIAKVFVAQESKHARVVALKILNHEALADAPRRKQLASDVRSAAGIVHPNVARVYRFGRLANGQHYVADEYIGGRALKDLHSDVRTIEEAKRILLGVARALKEMHEKGFAHGDLNASHVFVERDSGRVVVKDFELQSLDRSGAAISPDDVLSFGKLAHELLPDTASDSSLAQTLMRCLNAMPESGPTADELARLLDDGKPVEASLSPKQSTQRAAELSLMRAAVIGALFFVVLGVAVALWILVGVQF